MKLRRIDLYHEEFLAAVVGEMTPAELGVYWMICLLQYNRGGELLKYDMPWLRAKFRPGHGNRWVEDAVKRLIESGRLVVEGSLFGCSRVVVETLRARCRVVEASLSGHRGGRPRKDINGVEKGSGFFDEKLTTTTTTNNKKEEVAPLFITPPNGDRLIEPEAHGAPDGALNGKSKTNGGANGRQRATRLTQEWSPTFADRDFCIELGLEPNQTFGSFRDFWLAKPTNATKLDWSATWRNWCRRAADNKGKTTSTFLAKQQLRERVDAAMVRYALDRDGG